MTAKRTASGACVVLVPYVGFIHPGCEEGLRALERLGYEVRRLPGHSDIARGRSMIATAALHDGFDDLLWIDSDIVFSPSSVDALRAHDVTVVGGVYPQKGRRRLCVNPVARPVTLKFGKGGGLVEVEHVATGFLLTRRAAYEAIQRHHELPRCKGDGAGIIPFYQSLIHGNAERGFEYLSEDYSFCERARAAGHKVYADTSVRLGHVGSHEYGWEDAGSERKRFASYEYTFNA